jgi:hypothetical protein
MAEPFQQRVQCDGVGRLPWSGRLTLFLSLNYYVIYINNIVNKYQAYLLIIPKLFVNI